MAVCEGLGLVTFSRNENWQDGQGRLARVAIATFTSFVFSLVWVWIKIEGNEEREPAS